MLAQGAIVKEEAKAWRVPQLGHAELLRARYQRQNFSRHFHRRYALGVIEQGAMRFNYMGTSFTAAAGQVNLCIPAEAHDGRAEGEQGWRYRMFYLEPELLRRAAGEVAGRPKDYPYFKTGVIQDPELAGQIWALHTALEGGALSDLEMQSSLLSLLAGLVARHADDRPRPVQDRPRPRAVARAREYLWEHYQGNPSLADLSRVAGMSRFQLLRAFKSQMGLPPHAYLNLLRVEKAKQLMANGMGLAEVAHAVGFVDQSHLTRTFKKCFGITPGQYCKSLQD